MYIDNSVASWIFRTTMSKKFLMPQRKQYDGSTDPKDYVVEYKNRMFTYNILEDSYGAVVSKVFSFTLSNSTQKWFFFTTSQ